MIASPFPHIGLGPRTPLVNGRIFVAHPFCIRNHATDERCIKHYQALEKAETGPVTCPLGFESQVFRFGGKKCALTSLVVVERTGPLEAFGEAAGHEVAATTLDGVRDYLDYLAELEALRTQAVEEGAEILPLALHELRKLNAEVLHNAEKEIGKMGGTDGLLAIKGASALMRNNFDILEAMANMELMRAIPHDGEVNLFDEVFGTAEIFRERAKAKQGWILVSGSRAVVRGSQKSLPIVPSVLIENALKYGREAHAIVAKINAGGGKAVLTVENKTDYFMDVKRCFDKGTRFAADHAEGAGFGLHLAKEIVLAHKGTIRADRKGDTLTMIVELPLLRIAD